MISTVSNSINTRLSTLKAINTLATSRDKNKQLKALKKSREDAEIKSVVFSCKIDLKSRVRPQLGQLMP